MSIIAAGGAHRGSVRGFYPKVINGSLRFNSGDAPYLSYTNGTATNGKKCTLSFWIKKNEIIGSTTTARFIQAYSGVGNQFHSQWGDGATSPGDQWMISPGEQSSQQGMRMTDASLRDPSAWYHCVWKYNSESGSEESTLYINGVQQSSSVYTTAPTTDLVTSLTKSGTEVKIGYINSSMPDFQLADMYVIDGQALTASDFGETKNGVWVAKDYAGTFGTNGFYLTFEDDTEVEAFNTVLYRSQQPSLGVTGVGFKPDLVITKTRGISSGSTVMDSVRGASAMLSTASTGAESTTGGKGIISFDSDGFTLGTDADIGSSNYSNGTDYVAWCWDAGANNAVTGHSSVTWQGDDADNRHISGFPFTPDLIWVGPRTFNGANKQIYDSVRGFGLGKDLISNGTSAEGGESPTYGGIQSVTKNGFVTKSGSSGGGLEDAHINMYQNAVYFPGATGEYVAWAWDAGDGDPVSNTAGSITSTVKASTANGFSIVSYSGVAATDGSTNGGNPWGIGHGLTSAPDFVIYKMRTSSNGWYVYHSSLASTEHLVLNSTAAKATETVLFRDTPPDASELYVGGWDVVNRTGNDYIAYCFHDVTGKQKFGSYTGDGTSDGSLAITTGFRVGWLMIKRTDSAHDWSIIDASRSPFNPTTKELLANTSDSEATAQRVNFTDTGFELMNAGGRVNANGGTYIYAAFAGSYSDYITDYNTDGTNIDSRVKANQTTGFSIVSYEGSGTASDSFGHGLGTAPSMVIIKDRQLANSWLVQHSSVTGYLTLNSANAVAGTDQLTFGASTVTLNGTWDIMNGSGRPYIAYCWAETTGYSKFGSYTGNGSTDGPEITTGFPVAFLLVKNTTYADQWWILVDNTRSTSNPVDDTLFPNISNAEQDNDRFNFLSNGFKVINNYENINRSGDTFIYAAFADTREAAFWLDQSGNDNDWQPVNLDHNDTVADSPTNNFATWNPLRKNGAASTSDGNLVATFTTDSTAGIASTMDVTSGQYYWEITLDAGNHFVGVCPSNYSGSTSVVNFDGSLHYYASNGNTAEGTGSGNTQTSYGDTSGDGDVIGVALDMDAGTIEFYKNGTSLGSAVSLPHSNVGYGPSGSIDTGSLTKSQTANFGQQPFKYDPPE